MCGGAQGDRGEIVIEGYGMPDDAKTRRTVARNGRVLVVDDDRETAEEACELLTSAGYPAYSEANPEAVLDHLKTDRSVGLLLSDVRMPTLGGV